MPNNQQPRFCNRCYEEFPLNPDPKSPWRMGYLYPLSKFRGNQKRSLTREDHNNYLCGNCYFDLTD